MKFIEELTLMHKAAIGASLGLIMLLVVLSARRRRAAAGAPEARPAPEAKAPKRRGRAKESSALPRRKRRKLAAEAAHAMGVEATPVAPAAPEVPVITVPEVAIAQSVATHVEVQVPVAVQPAEHVPVGVGVDHAPEEAILGDPGAFVAQPGWPSPGELASSFDPDAFDPLPEMHEPQEEEAMYDDVSEALASDDTSAIELLDLSTAAEVAALTEIDEWADAVEPGADWDEDDDGLPSGNWTISEPVSEPLVAVASEPMDLEDIWSEPDDEPTWDQASEPQPVAEVELAAQDDEALVALTTEEADDDAFELTVDEDADFEMPLAAWTDGTPSTWEPAEVTDVSVTGQTAPSSWSEPIGGPNSPVVLDLAGLAASGQSLELTIEPNGDGPGVRLRFGPALAAPVDARAAETPPVEDVAEDAPDSPVAEAPPAVDDVADERDTFWESSFLAGVPLTEEPAAVVVAPIEAHEAEQLEDTVVDEPRNDTPEQAATFVDYASQSTFDPASSDGAFAFDTEPAGSSTTSAVMDADDDPARILADIRARLAALDAQR